MLQTQQSCYNFFILVTKHSKVFIYRSVFISILNFVTQFHSINIFTNSIQFLYKSSFCVFTNESKLMFRRCFCEVYTVLSVDRGQFGNVALWKKKGWVWLFCPVDTKGCFCSLDVNCQGLRMRGRNCMSTASERLRCVEKLLDISDEGEGKFLSKLIPKPLISVCRKQFLACCPSLKNVCIYARTVP